MSRGFNGTNAVLTRSAGLITTFPFTINVWFRPAALSGNEVDFFCTHDQGVTSNVVRLFMDGLDNYRVTLGLYDGAYDFAKATGNPTTNAWQMATAVVTSASSYSCFYNAGGKATNTTPSSINLTATNRVSLGRESFGTSNWFNGQLAHCTVWNAALTDDEVAMLYAGLVSTRIRPASLTAYWSLSGKDSPEIDIVGRNDLTVTNATVSNEEPRIARALSSYLVALGGTNGTPITPEPAPAPAPPPGPTPPPEPGVPAVMNTRFTGLSWVASNDYSPEGKDYLLSGIDSETGQVFSTTSPRIWGSEWASPRIQLLNSNPPVGTPDTAWTRTFTADGLQITRNINYSGVPQAVYRILPNAPFNLQGMCYIRGKIKLPAALPTVDGAGIFLCEVKNNYTDQKLQFDIGCSADPMWGNVPRWQARLSTMRREYGIYNLWGASQNTPYKNTVPQQDIYYQSPITDVNQVSIYSRFGAFADDPNGAAPDWTRWFTYEFAFRLQSPNGLVSGDAPQGWVWCATSTGTTSEPPPNGTGAQRFYLTGRNMNSEPNPGATIIFPFGHYSGFNGITGLPITWRQVEVYDRWPNDASVHPADAL